MLAALSINAEEDSLPIYQTLGTKPTVLRSGITSVMTLTGTNSTVSFIEMRVRNSDYMALWVESNQRAVIRNVTA